MASDFQAGASEQVARETGAHEPVRRSGEPDDEAVVHQPVAHEPVVREPVVRQPVAYTRSTTKPGAVPKEQPAPEPEPTDPTAREHQDFVEDFELTSPVEPEPSAEAPDQAALIEEPARKAEPPRRGKGKKARPIVPSWEDVLLGTRSNRG
ncbi:hypothetical protein GCM10023148_56610 [Actinokineospora soli]